MKIFTCTPVSFGGNAGFFERDSGLLCRGLQMIGVESRAVMPLPEREDDEEDLIRTEFGNLESAAWWRGHGLDGVVLYAWGAPRYRKVARAIREAGVFLILNQDNGGLVSPLAGPRLWLEEQRNLAGRGHGLAGWWRFAKLVAKGFTVGLAAIDPLRARHLKFGDVIACVSPGAAAHYKRLCGIYGGAELAGKVEVLPHAVSPAFRWKGKKKQRRVVCVGRWNDVVQKRPGFLAQVVEWLLETDTNVEVAVAGQADESLLAWHGRLEEGLRGRVGLLGKVGREELRELMAASCVFYSPSAYESFGIAAAEALCCGCSVVAAESVSMVSFEWFTEDGCGSLARPDRVTEHVACLLAELDAWDRGERDARKIAGRWRARVHADAVAAKVVARLRRGAARRGREC